MDNANVRDAEFIVVISMRRHMDRMSTRSCGAWSYIVHVKHMVQA
jgi:hypothetical protein